MTKSLIYLSGQITGASYDEARFGWRAKVHQTLSGYDCACISPMRSKGHLAGMKALDRMGGVAHALDLPAAIVARDRSDVMRCDLMFLNYLGMSKISFGCAAELGWADAYRKPVVCCIEPDGSNPNDHAFLRGGMVGWFCSTLEEGIEVVKAVLTEKL